MSCNEFYGELSRWLETVWDAENPGNGTPPASLSRHSDECEGCRNRLESALSLIKAHSTEEAPQRFLAARINENLLGIKLKDHGHLALYSSIAAAFAIMLIAVGLMIGPFKVNRGGESELLVKFTLEAPAASQVYVVGDWNNWNAAADPLHDDNSDGLWEATIKLEAGNEYRYQFYIDSNRWVADPNAPLKIDDGFGGQNSILRI